MQRVCRAVLAILIIWAGLATAVTAQGDDAALFQAGIEAHNRKDYATAALYFHRLAEQGNANAQYNLGLMYDNGQGVAQNYAEALRWYRLAAEQGNANAQINLGFMYHNGKGGVQNYAEALRWFRLAAEQGNTNAQFNLGNMYRNGQGVAQNYAEALKWYKRAADQGDAGSLNNLGVLFEFGQGALQNFVYAHMYYNLGASRSAVGEEYERAIRNRKSIATKMTPAQVAEAQRLAQVWSAKHETALAIPTPAPAPVVAIPAALVAEAQRLLARLGFDVGAADGIVGARTSAAVRTYQSRKRLAPTGEIGEPLVGSMRQDVAAAASTASPPQSNEPKVVGSGSGFFVTSAGHVLTNSHVVEKCGLIRVRSSEGSTNPVRVLTRIERDDLALLKGAIKPGATAAFRSGPPIRQGDAVLIYGFPLAGALASAGNLTTGNVVAMAGIRDDTRLIQISAPIQPGNSGGPVVDSSGNVIAIVVGKLDALKVAVATGDMPQNVNFAIKSSVAINLLETRGIGYEVAVSERERSAADIAERVRAFTVKVECLR